MYWKLHLKGLSQKTLRNTMSMVKIAKNIVFVLIFNFFFKILAIIGTETLGGCPQLVADLAKVFPLLVTEIVGVSITCH